MKRIADFGKSVIGSVLVVVFATGASPAFSQAEGFEQCIANIERLAVERGIRPETASRVLATVQPLERVIRADRNQPEFVQTFGAYLALRVTPQRVAAGRVLYDEHRALLAELSARYGVPGQYLVAFWALESNFGSVTGNVPVFDSLSTLACDQRRSGYFTRELIDALSIVDDGHAEPTQMIGSWAGAMGQTQFMPSVYIAHAADGDGDGRIDLWTSAPDALASAARYLASLGWIRGYRWGREVALPDGFDYALAGSDQPHPLVEWRERGVRDVNGQPLPASDIEAALLVPSGSTGPAFVVYENFDVIMRWNRSEFFALTVGHLADRVAGGGGLSRPPPDTPPLTRAQLRALQAALAERGLDPGPADGLLGPSTRAAIREFQARGGLVADGHPTIGLLEQLGLE